MRQWFDIVQLGCKDGARRGAGHTREGLPQWGTRSDQESSLRPESGKGALADGDIMDHIWPKRYLTCYPQPKCQEFQPLPHRPPSNS